MENLKIDPEFQNKIPPLTQEEFERLEANILEDGEVREPIVVWDDTIVDGHNRWRIIQEHPEIPYKIKYMDFPDKWAAIVWMCRNQLGRRNITDAQKTVLIGEAYEAQKKSVGNHAEKERGADGRFTVLAQNGPIRTGKNSHGTRSIIADEFGVGHNTVQRASDFVKGLNAADEIEPGFRDAVVSGEITVPKSIVREIDKLVDEARPQVVAKIKEGDNLSAKEIIQKYKESPAPFDEDGIEADIEDEDARGEEPQEEERKSISVEDLCELIDAAMHTMEFALRIDLVETHQDVLQQDGATDAVIKALNRGSEIIRKYRTIMEGLNK